MRAKNSVLQKDGQNAVCNVSGCIISHFYPSIIINEYFNEC